MANDFTYVLTITDNGTPVIQKVSAGLAGLGKSAKTSMSVTEEATARASAAFKNLGINIESLGAKGKAMQTQLAQSMQKVINKEATDTLKQYGLVSEDSGKKAAEGMKKTAAEATATHRAVERLYRTALAFVGMWVLTKVLAIPRELISTVLEFNSQLETAKLGIASILIAQGKFTDSIGQSAEGYGALIAAQQLSGDLVKQLQIDNLKTIATFDQLVKAFQQTLAPGLERGFDIQQVREFTLAMVQAAGAMGLNLDMLAEETRSLLRGTISPRQTLIATALGITNEDVRRFQGNAQALFDFLMGKLKAFSIAGIESQRTWTGLISNLKDATKMILGIGMEDLFKFAKKEAQALLDHLVVVDEYTKEMKLNPELMDSLKRLGYLIQASYETIKDIVGIIGLLREPVDLIAEAWRSISISVQSVKNALGMGGEGKGFTPWKSPAAPPDAPEWLKKISDKNIFGVAIAILDMFNDLINKAVEGTGRLKDSWELVQTKWYYGVTPRELREVEIDYLSKAVTEIGYMDDKLRENLQTKLKSKGISEDLLSLQGLQLQALIKSVEEYSKLKDTGPETDEAFRKMIAARIAMAKVETEQAPAKTLLQIAQATNQYDLQRKLIDSANEAGKIKLKNAYGILYGNKQITPELQKQLDAMDAMANLSKAAVDHAEKLAALSRKGDIISLQQKYAGMVGDIFGQMAAMAEAVDIEVKKIYVDMDKLVDPITNMITDSRALADLWEQIRLKRKIGGEEQERFGIVESITRFKQPLAEVGKSWSLMTGNFESYERFARQGLGNEITLLKERNKKAETYLPFLQDRIKYMEKIFEIELEIQKVQSETYAPDKLAQVRAQLGGMTLDFQLQEKAAKVLLQSQIDRITADVKLNGVQEDYISILQEIEDRMSRMRKVQSEIYAPNLIAQARSEVAGMTGDLEAQREVGMILLENKLKEIVAEDKIRGDNLIILTGYLLQAEALKQITAELNKQKEVLGWQQQLSELQGDYVGSKTKEIELLEKERQLLYINNAGREDAVKAVKELYDRLVYIAKAEKDMDVPKLMDIGMDAYFFNLRKQLTDTVENFLPKAIDAASNSMSQFFTELTDGATKFEDAIKNLGRSFARSVLEMIKDLTMLIMKMELLKALGYEEATTPKTSGTSLLSSLASAVIGGLFGGTSTSASSIAPASSPGGYPTAFAAKGGIFPSLLAHYPINSYQGGGIARSPQIGIFGESGDEAFVPLSGGKIPVSLKRSAEGGGSPTYVIMNIEATDVDSFERRYGSSVNKIIRKSERQSGSLTKLTR